MDRAKTRILIADPDPDIQKTLQLYFETHGHEVKSAATAGEVAQIAGPWQPNAIIISDELRGEDPYQLCRHLMEDTLASHIPLIMLLRLNERRSRLAALEVGVADIISKPFDIEELRLRVEAAIRLASMRVGL